MYPKLTARQVRSVPIYRLPVLVLTDALNSWVSRRIKQHTHGEYNHAMMMHDTGMVASQNLFYTETQIDYYLQGNHRVKLWTSDRWDWEAMLKEIRRQLALPLYRRAYDWLGIVGARFHVESFNLPWRNYCSENVAQVLRAGLPIFDLKHPSPADLDRWATEAEKLGLMKCMGVFDPNDQGARNEETVRIRRYSPAQPVG